MKTTYESSEVGRYDKVWVSTPGSGLEKRQCTLQLCFSPEDNTCRVYIIFRGTKDGHYIAKAEKDQYHPAVDVLWQKNAWADTEVCNFFSLDFFDRELRSFAVLKIVFPFIIESCLVLGFT